MITVRVERVRKKARLDETYDIDIQETIDEMIPYIESKIDEEYLNTEDTSVKSIINLAATEIIIGEFIKEQSNDEDDSVSIGVGPIKIGENSSSKNRMSRAKDFVNDGWEKLKPYLIQDEDPFYFGIMGG